MADVMRKALEHRGDRFSKAGDLSFYFVKETILRTFEEPAASDLILAISVEGDDQGPEQLESEARQSGDRMRKATIAGRIDHGEKTVRMEIRPPGQLTGTDTIMGSAMMEALFGSERIVNTQSKVALTAINSHSRAGGTIVDMTAGEEAFQLGDVVAIRSNNATSAAIDGQPACVSNVAWPGGGVLRLTLEPALSGEPVIGGTPDEIQGGITWKPTNDWGTTWSALWTQGFEGDQAEGSVNASATFNIDGRNFLTADFSTHYRKTIYSAIGFVSGESGNDSFATTDTVLDVDDASIYSIGSLVDLVRFDVATELEDAREIKAQITALDETSSPNTVTLTRGTTPIDVTGGTHDLTVATPDADQEVLTTLAIVAGDFIRIEIDHRGFIDVPLTVNAAATATDIANDINAALQYSALYGQATDAPFTDVNWSTAASVSPANSVKITSQAYGSQSHFKATLTGLAGDRFADLWIPAATFERDADKEVQIVQWTPGGTITTSPIVNKDGVCRVNGYQFLIAQGNVTVDNQVEHIEDVKTGDDYETAHLEGRERLVTAAITQPAFGWTARLRRMAETNEGLFMGFVVGETEGFTFSIFLPKAIPGTASKSGDNRQDKAYTCTAEDPGITVTAPTSGTVYKLHEVVAGLT